MKEKENLHLYHMFKSLNTYPKNYKSKKRNCYLNTNKSKLKEKDINRKLLAVNTICFFKGQNINLECIII